MERKLLLPRLGKDSRIASPPQEFPAPPLRDTQLLLDGETTLILLLLEFTASNHTVLLESSILQLTLLSALNSQ
jgi:hypothetical protein